MTLTTAPAADGEVTVSGRVPSVVELVEVLTG